MGKDVIIALDFDSREKTLAFLDRFTEEKPFVKVGSKVKKGDTLCIIEAMKLMNEITAEQDGEIVDICVKSGEVVEYSQTLFKIF